MYKYAYFAVIIVGLAQLYVPASMIWEREEILSTGKEFKFKTAPIDPTDVLRGKYIYLNFAERRVEVKNAEVYKRYDNIYLRLAIDSLGYVMVQSYSKDKPSDTDDFVRAKVNYSYGNYIPFDFPFERYYMEESKAPVAEKIYNELRRDTNQVAYALVKIKDGESVLEDVMIDGVSIKDIVKMKMDKQK